MRFFPPSYPKAGVIPSSSSVVGGIKIQYPAHPYNLVLTFQIILLITSLIHYSSVWRNSQRNLQIKLPISFLVKTHYKTSVQISVIIVLNRANSYDSNGIYFTSLPILEGEIRNLPDYCLHTITGQPLRIRKRIIYR